MTDDSTAGTKPKTAKKAKRSKAAIAKQIATMKAKREAKATGNGLPSDVVGAIAALRAAKRDIMQRMCSGELKDLGYTELNVFIALNMLQGKSR